MINWLLNPANNALITWIGFVVGVLGTLLGLAGIGLTLRQLRLIRTETEAANRAINAVQIKVSSFDVAQECTKSADIVQSIRSSWTNSDWQKVLSEYESLIQRFLNITHSTSPIADSDKQVIFKYTEDMAKICSAIRRKVSEDDSSIMLRGHDVALRNFANIITKLPFPSQGYCSSDRLHNAAQKIS